MAGFHPVLLEGVFYFSEDPYPDSNGELHDGFMDLMVAPPHGAPQSVYKALEPLIGQRVQLAMHHVPPMPIDATRWGGGSCLLEPTGYCPFGHHNDPNRMFNLAMDGVLVYDMDHKKGEGGWWLQTFDGKKTMLPLTHVLLGHRGRIAAASITAVEEMRDALEATGNLAAVEDLGQKANDLQDLLSRLKQVVQED